MRKKRHRWKPVEGSNETQCADCGMRRRKTRVESASVNFRTGRGGWSVRSAWSYMIDGQWRTLPKLVPACKAVPA